MKYLLPLIILLSCTKEDPKIYTREEIFRIAKKADPTMKLVLPLSVSQAVVNCHEYKPACDSGHRVKIKGLELVALRYTSPEVALKAAKSIRAYYARNWVFDDTAGEPILERFVKENFEAKLAE